MIFIDFFLIYLTKKRLKIPINIRSRVKIIKAKVLTLVAIRLIINFLNLPKLVKIYRKFF